MSKDMEWRPREAGSMKTNDLITKCMEGNYHPERLSERQLAAVQNWPNNVSLGGERGALATQRIRTETESRHALIAIRDKARAAA